jgi:predicted lipid-binding transport protein (Tim44 family)
MMSDQKPDQAEQAEWEVVDTAGSQQAPPRASRAATMRALLGPWWRWKVAGFILSFAIVAALVFAMAGVMFVLGVAIVLVSLVVAKVRQLLRQSGSSITR